MSSPKVPHRDDCSHVTSARGTDTSGLELGKHKKAQLSCGQIRSQPGKRRKKDRSKEAAGPPACLSSLAFFSLRPQHSGFGVRTECSEGLGGGSWVNLSIFFASHLSAGDFWDGAQKSPQLHFHSHLPDRYRPPLSGILFSSATPSPPPLRGSERR